MRGVGGVAAHEIRLALTTRAGDRSDPCARPVAAADGEGARTSDGTACLGRSVFDRDLSAGDGYLAVALRCAARFRIGVRLAIAGCASHGAREVSGGGSALGG